MKFLDNVTPEQEVLPLNYLYFNERNFQEDDVLSIVYKDVKTGETHVQNIVKPEIEIWIIKPEYRKHITHNHNWMKKEALEPHKVRYRNRYREIAKILDLKDIEGKPDTELAKTSPLVYFSNIDIRSYYALQFIHEYNVPEEYELNVGLFDIENDIIDIDHFPTPGECPISLIAFIDVKNETVYQFVLEPRESSHTINPNTGRYYDYRDQVAHMKEHVNEYIQELHEAFDESYGVLDYHIVFMKDEEDMISKFFKLFEILNIDFALAWNAAYDMSNLTCRPERIMRNPIELICSDKFKVKECAFREDTNPQFHKRKHYCQISHPTVFVDQMVIYAGIRSASGRIPSLKLNAIAQKEIGDTKIDYSEQGSIRELPYEDFWKYCKYSIKDTLLQLGIHRKTNDVMGIYSRMLEDGLLPNEVFTSTIQLTNSLSSFLLDKGYIPGNNANKFTTDQILRQQNQIFGVDADDSDIEDAMVDPDSVGSEEDSNEFEESGASSNKKRKKQFTGAMVQDPNRMLSTGFKIGGTENTKVHEWTGDMDITSEYPVAMILMNLSSETFIGIVELVQDLYDWFLLTYGNDWVEKHRTAMGTYEFSGEEMSNYKFNRLPMYNYDFIDEDAATYKINLSDTIVMMMAYDDVVHIGEQFMNLPTYEELRKNNMVVVRERKV